MTSQGDDAANREKTNAGEKSAEMEQQIEALKKQIEELTKLVSTPATPTTVSATPGPAQNNSQGMNQETRELFNAITLRLDERNQKLPFAATMDSLPKFSGDDITKPVKSWTKRVTGDALKYSWSPAETLLAATRALTGTAKVWIDAREEIATWEQLKEEIEKNFRRRVTNAEIHERLSQRSKKKEETALAYVHEMESIGAQANFQEDEIRDYIIKGVTDDINIRLTLTNRGSREDFISLLEVYEKSSKEKTKTTVTSKNAAKNQAERRPMNEERCFNCGKRGHMSRECPDKEKGVKCFSCHEYGHKSYECPKKNEKAAEETIQKCTEARGPIGLIKTEEDKNRSKVSAIIGGMTVQCQLDSGACWNIVREDLFEEVAKKDGQLKSDGHIETVIGAYGEGPTLGRVCIPTIIEGVNCKLCYRIVPNKYISEKILLGDPILDEVDIQLKRDGPIIKPIVKSECINSSKEEKKNKVKNNLEEVREEFEVEVKKSIQNYESNEVTPIRSEVKNDEFEGSHPKEKDEDAVNVRIDEVLQKSIEVPSCQEQTLVSFVKNNSNELKEMMFVFNDKEKIKKLLWREVLKNQHRVIEDQKSRRKRARNKKKSYKKGDISKRVSKHKMCDEVLSKRSLRGPKLKFLIKYLIESLMKCLKSWRAYADALDGDESDYEDENANNGDHEKEISESKEVKGEKIEAMRVKQAQSVFLAKI